MTEGPEWGAGVYRWTLTAVRLSGTHVCPVPSCVSSSHRNVMMRLNLQLTMGTFSLSLFGLIGVAFGMNLESSLEEVTHRPPC